MIAILEDADAPFPIHASRHHMFWRRILLSHHLAVDDFKRLTSRQFEPTYRWDIADRLVLPFVVVVEDPGIEGSLGLLESCRRS